MKQTRSLHIPIDHLLAEIIAFPLATEESFSIGLTALKPSLQKETAELWRAAEKTFLGNFPSFSVDEAVALRDRVWFGDKQNLRRLREGSDMQDVSLVCYLRNLASKLLENDGLHAKPKLTSLIGFVERVHGDACEKRSRKLWRWLYFALPPDLLLAAFHGGNAKVGTLAPNLQRLLEDKGYAEVHLHVGAALAFQDMWVAVLRGVADGKEGIADFCSPSAQFSEGKLLGDWLVRAAIVRYLLAEFLACRQNRGQKFIAYLDSSTFFSKIHLYDVANIVQVLRDVGLGRLQSHGDVKIYSAFLQHLTGLAAPRSGAWQSLDQSEDPIARFFPPTTSELTPEMLFVSSSLNYIDEKTGDAFFSRLFWQVIRIRGIYYRHIIQRPMTPGLQWFIRFYGRLRPASRLYGTKSRIQAALDGNLKQGLRSLEIRTAPEKTEDKQIAEINQVDEKWKEVLAERHHHPLFELGLVLHLSKERGGGSNKGAPKAYGLDTNARPDLPINQGYRYAEHYRSLRERTLALARTMMVWPLTLQVVRGIDVCTDEMGVPTWVLSPLFRYLRKAGAIASQSLLQKGIRIPNMRKTAHVGEDFIHLMSGLRRVQEAIEFLQLGSGDRIGHGLALGIEPQEWSHRAGRIPITREERLFNLSWEWSWRAKGHRGFAVGSGEYLEKEIAMLSAHLFGKPLFPYQIEQLHRDLYNERLLRSVGFPDGPHPTRKLSEQERLLIAYLSDGGIFQRGQEIEWLDPRGEADVLLEIQRWLRKMVSQAGISVEVNPSSNLLIGNFSDLAKHPLWRLRSPDPSEQVAPISICIGSDDPLTFASTLPQEYQLVLDAFQDNFFDKDTAQEWLNRVRENSLNARFTIQRVAHSVKDFTNMDRLPEIVPPP